MTPAPRLTATQIGDLLNKALETYAPVFKELNVTAEVKKYWEMPLIEMLVRSADSYGRLDVRPIDIDSYGFAYTPPSVTRAERTAGAIEITVHGDRAKQIAMRRVTAKSSDLEADFKAKFETCLGILKTTLADIRADNVTKAISLGKNEKLMEEIDFVREPEDDPHRNIYQRPHRPSAYSNAIVGELRNGIHIRIGTFHVPHDSFELNIETYGGLSVDQVKEIITRLNDPNFGARIR